MKHAISAFMPRICAALASVALMLLSAPLHAQADPPSMPPPIAGRAATLDTATITNFAVLRSRAAQSDRKVPVIARLSQAAVGGGAINQAAEVAGETTELRRARSADDADAERGGDSARRHRRYCIGRPSKSTRPSSTNWSRPAKWLSLRRTRRSGDTCRHGSNL